GDAAWAREVGMSGRRWSGRSSWRSVVGLGKRRAAGPESRTTLGQFWPLVVLMVAALGLSASASAYQRSGAAEQSRLTTLSTGYSAEVLADSPAAYWRLAETGGNGGETAVDQMGTYNGTYIHA